MISIIAGIDKNWLIGDGDKLPWHIPEDLAYFKKVTSGHSIVMGRKTFESIGRPLPNRENIILTRKSDYTAEGCTVINNPEEIQNATNGREIFIIGGANVYEQFLPRANRLYLTRIDGEYSGDTYFPKPDMDNWTLSSQEEATSKSGVQIVFEIWERD